MVRGRKTPTEYYVGFWSDHVRVHSPDEQPLAGIRRILPDTRMDDARVRIIRHRMVRARARLSPERPGSARIGIGQDRSFGCLAIGSIGANHQLHGSGSRPPGHGICLHEVPEQDPTMALGIWAVAQIPDYTFNS